MNNKYFASYSLLSLERAIYCDLPFLTHHLIIVQQASIMISVCPGFSEYWFNFDLDHVTGRLAIDDLDTVTED